MDKGRSRRISSCRKVPHKNTHPREHWTRKRGQWKPKKDFVTIKAGNSYIKKYRRINYCSYVCPICGGVHIGYKGSDND